MKTRCDYNYDLDWSFANDTWSFGTAPTFHLPIQAMVKGTGRYHDGMCEKKNHKFKKCFFF